MTIENEKLERVKAALRKVMEQSEKVSALPWYPGHLCNDDHSCDCRYVFDQAHMGAVCSVHVDNGKEISDGGNDDPPIQEAKANQAYIATACNMGAPMAKALLEIIADAETHSKSSNYLPPLALKLILNQFPDEP